MSTNRRVHPWVAVAMVALCLTLASTQRRVAAHELLQGSEGDQPTSKTKRPGRTASKAAAKDPKPRDAKGPEINRSTRPRTGDIEGAAPASDEPASPLGEDSAESGGRLWANARTRTLGGVQFWADELVFNDWRIQRNVLTGHCRLLDGDDRRQAWGSFEQCNDSLENFKTELNLPPMQGRVVIVIHGLGGWKGTMKPLASYLAEKGDFTVISINYPSTRAELGDHARSLASIVEHLEGVEQIDFVCHSLGNLVLRHYLGDAANSAEGAMPDPRIKRIVMLAPPNHGSERAARWSDSDLFLAVLGGAAQQLGSGWESVEGKLGTPKCEFGIIAGGRGDDRGYSSRLTGDDDGTIEVSTTRLAGARDFLVVPVWHSFMMISPTVQESALRFLQKGYFVSAKKRSPIPATRE